MNGTHAGDAAIQQPLDSTHPQFKVRIQWIFDQYSHFFVSLQRVGNGLHSKGIGRRSGTHPQDIDVGIQGIAHVFDGRHLSSNEHTRLTLDLLQPCQSAVAHTLKAARHRAGFPDARPEHLYASGMQCPCRVQCLLLGLGTARSCDNNGGTIIKSIKPQRLYVL